MLKNKINNNNWSGVSLHIPFLFLILIQINISCCIAFLFK